MNNFTLCMANPTSVSASQRIRQQCRSACHALVCIALSCVGGYVGMQTSAHLWPALWPDSTSATIARYPESVVLSAVSACLAQAKPATPSGINGEAGEPGSELTALTTPAQTKSTDASGRQQPSQPHWFISSKGQVWLFQPEGQQWQPAP
jgi:hypothetical protein